MTPTNIPAAPARHPFDVAAFARERLAFRPDPGQARALDPSIRRGLLNCCRQWGKSTTVALTPPVRRIPPKSQDFLHTLGMTMRGDGDNETSVMLPNGSRIAGLPGREATIRGFSNVALLLIDPTKLCQAVRPMVAVNPDAAIWLMFTPNGRQGFFYDEWSQGGPGWTRVEAPATHCPRIRPPTGFSARSISASFSPPTSPTLTRNRSSTPFARRRRRVEQFVASAFGLVGRGQFVARRANHATRTAAGQPPETLPKLAAWPGD